MREGWESQLQALMHQHQSAFSAYFDMLVDWNERMNLTGITDRDEVFIKHFFDSLSVLMTDTWINRMKPGARVADVGTGAGFPGLPLAICCEDVEFVLCDALAKRLSFLEEVVHRLGLQNVQLVHGRAEDLAHQPAYRQVFDAVVSRAVAKLNVLAEITVPFVRVGGVSVAMKGPGVVDELPDGERSCRLLGAQLAGVETLVLPKEAGVRNIVFMEVLKESPKRFPRKAGTPQKSPL